MRAKDLKTTVKMLNCLKLGFNYALFAGYTAAKRSGVSDWSAADFPQKPAFNFRPQTIVYLIQMLQAFILRFL